MLAWDDPMPGLLGVPLFAAMVGKRFLKGKASSASRQVRALLPAQLYLVGQSSSRFVPPERVGKMLMARLGGGAGSRIQIAAVAVQNVTRTDVGAAG